jgi:hypothetical protein
MQINRLDRWPFILAHCGISRFAQSSLEPLPAMSVFAAGTDAIYLGGMAVVYFIATLLIDKLQSWYSLERAAASVLAGTAHMLPRGVHS